MRKILATIVLLSAIISCGKAPKVPTKESYMWIDYEANHERMESDDSLHFYLDRIRKTGFTSIVVDVKPITGYVDTSRLSEFISYGHKAGLKVFASMNVFCGGHNHQDSGIIYKEHPEFQSMVYTPKGIIPISEFKSDYNGMVNPVDPAVQEYEMGIIKDIVKGFPSLDGLIFDRLRFRGIDTDFSDLSRKAYEKYCGHTMGNFPQDVFSYGEKGEIVPGPEYKGWIEWRAMVIKDFLARARKEVKAINPSLILGDYTGAWYPTYYNEGVNWASETFDASTYFSWADSTYRKTGYAELLDLYMTGLYYITATKAEVDKVLSEAAGNPTTTIEGVHSEIDRKYAQDYWFCVEGGAEWAKKITAGVVPVAGSVLVSQYADDMSRFKVAAKQALDSTDGLMCFDLIWVIKYNVWKDLEEILHGGDKRK